MRLPAHILQFLTAHKYEVVEIIQISSWKKTVVLLVRKDNKNYVLKAVSKDSPLAIKQKFLVETSVYRKISIRHIPRAAFTSEQILVLEFLNGKTLRQTLHDSELASPLLGKLSLAAEAFYQEGKQNEEHSVDFQNATANLISLARSGPIQTKKLPRWEEVINRVISALLLRALGKELKKIDPSGLRYGFAHGDFHYNNIFITEENEIKFIDFENVCYNQCFDFDLLYLLTMIEALSPAFDGAGFDPINALRSMVYAKKEMCPIHQLYRLAAMINPRFNPKALGIADRIILTFRLVVNSSPEAIEQLAT